VLYWLNCHQVRILNVAGPREGKHCPVYDHAYGFLKELFSLLQRHMDAREPESHYSVKTQETGTYISAILPILAAPGIQGFAE
jgi:hypothetical protein